MVHDFMRAYGLVTKPKLLERNVLDLTKDGFPAEAVAKIFEEAQGGCLFLDEAHNIATDDRMAEEIRGALLTAIENNKSSVQVMIGGYKEDIAKLMRSDPGMDSRFAVRIHVPNFTHAECVEIARRYAQRQGFEFIEDLGPAECVV